jgi:hypothetical protein
MQRFNQLDKNNVQTRNYYTEGIKNSSPDFNFRSLDREKVVLPSIFFEYDSDHPLSDIDMRSEYGGQRQNFDSMYIGHIFIKIDEVINTFKTSNTLDEALKSLLSIINTTVGNI